MARAVGRAVRADDDGRADRRGRRRGAGGARDAGRVPDRAAGAARPRPGTRVAENGSDLARRRDARPARADRGGARACGDPAAAGGGVEGRRGPGGSARSRGARRGVSPRASATAHELARVALLAELPGETLARLAQRMEREDVPAGQVLLREGEEGDRFYVLLNGMLTVSQASRGNQGVLLPG